MQNNNQATQYTVAALKSQYKTFKKAKLELNIKAQSWQALVDKLNAPNYQQLKEQLLKLQQENQALRQENDALKNSISKTEDFDEVGFWLLDKNFNRSNFSDFGISEEETKIESKSKNFYKKLAQKYHPDQGGTEMQMTNLNRLYEQMMALVIMNNGLGR